MAQKIPTQDEVRAMSREERKAMRREMVLYAESLREEARSLIYRTERDENRAKAIEADKIYELIDELEWDNDAAEAIKSANA